MTKSFNACSLWAFVTKSVVGFKLSGVIFEIQAHSLNSHYGYVMGRGQTSRLLDWKVVPHTRLQLQNTV